MIAASQLSRIGWGSPPTEAHSDTSPNLLPALQSELEHFGLLVGVTACIAQALSSGRMEFANASALRTYMPPEPLIYPLLIRDIDKVRLHREAITALQSFHARLELHRNIANQLAHAAELGRTASQSELHSLVDAWRGLAGSAYVALILTERAADRADTAGNISQMSVTSRLLRAITSGHFPCVDEDGIVSVPGWKERRAEERREHTLPVKVWSSSLALTATLTNISRSGAGLRNVFGVIKGDHISIELPTGRVLQGEVIWSADGGLGVRLSEPLSESDPLLTV